MDPRSLMVRVNTAKKANFQFNKRPSLKTEGKEQQRETPAILLEPLQFTQTHSQDHAIHRIQIQRETTDKYEIQTARKIEAHCCFKQEALPGRTRGGKGRCDCKSL